MGARANIDGHNSSLRLPALESLILVVDRLAFDDPELQCRVAHNIEASHVYAALGLALLVLAQGDDAMKRDRFRQWYEQYGERMTLGLLKDLVRGEYVSLRLVSCGPPSWHQRSLFPVADRLPSQSAVRAQQLPMFAISEGGSPARDVLAALARAPGGSSLCPFGKLDHQGSCRMTISAQATINHCRAGRGS